MLKKVSFTVKGRIPSKKNNQQIVKMGKNGRSIIVPSKKFKEWQNWAFIQLMQQKVPKAKFKCSLIELRIYFPDNRKADLTNKTESIQDMMTEYGVIEDDNWKCTGPVMLFPYYDKENPRCEITLWITSEDK